MKKRDGKRDKEEEEETGRRLKRKRREEEEEKVEMITGKENFRENHGED